MSGQRRFSIFSSINTSANPTPCFHVEYFYNVPEAKNFICFEAGFTSVGNPRVSFHSALAFSPIGVAGFGFHLPSSLLKRHPRLSLLLERRRRRLERPFLALGCQSLRLPLTGLGLHLGTISFYLRGPRRAFFLLISAGCSLPARTAE